MFYGMSSDHEFHQLIASRTSSSVLPISLCFDHNPSFSSAAFDPCPSSSLNTKILQQLQESPTIKNCVDGRKSLNSNCLALEAERSAVPWSDEEVIALSKFRSGIAITIPEFSWVHVSRKLGEIGFKRTPEECKEKFEEGNHFNSALSCTKNCRIYNELDEFIHHDHQEEAPVSAELHPNVDTKNLVDHQDNEMSGNDKEGCPESEEVMTRRKAKSSKKRKRKEKLGTLRAYFEAIVDKVMAQQEELHNKLIESIVKRDEEKIAQEEAWKIQEMNRNKTEIETRAKDQASAAERHAIIIEFLKKFTHEDLNIKNNTQNLERGEVERLTSLSSFIQTDKIRSPKPNPSSASALMTSETPSAANSDSTTVHERGGDAGSKRWPRDEVLALINLRCKLSYNNTNTDMINKEGQKGPLWERISQGMAELGYKRSAKRCKEKWENINKYFRKTKDSNKKRSVDSRTCPYFHQLNSLYSGRTLVAQGEEQQNVS